MKQVFKVIGFLCMFMFISDINAYSFDEGKEISNSYINNNRKNIAYLINTSKIPFGYNNKTISYIDGFNTGGLINIYEVNSSKTDDSSYLVTSLPYFSIDGKVINDESSTDSNIRVTEFIKKEVKIIGSGTYKDPWTFVPYNLLEVSSSDENKGTVSPSYAFVYDGGDAIFTVTPKTGYKYYSSTCTNIIVNNDKITFKNINKDEKCTINFIENKVKLTYDNNGGSGCSSKDVSYGLNYGELCTPVKSGYDFMGWYTALNGGVKVNANTKVTTNTNHTLYAHWKSTLESICTGKTLANCLKDNYTLFGLTKISQTATGNQNYATTEYRYQGKNPNNYITFNGETGVWRIIGVFEVETPNGSGYTKEYKVKLLRNSNDIIEPWNLNNNNDWVNATLKTTLNSGAYYNRTNAYRSIGLTSKSKSQISTTKWYLGNVGAKKDSYGTYKEERSKNVWSGNSQTWDGNVALMYPSDYMFGSSSCYNNGTDILGHNNSTCENTNWFVTGSPWTISPYTISSDLVIWMNDWSDVLQITVLNPDTFSAKPSVYLNANTKYTGGEGTISNPFTIE